jgi:hypothetical protein
MNAFVINVFLKNNPVFEFFYFVVQRRIFYAERIENSGRVEGRAGSVDYATAYKWFP